MKRILLILLVLLVTILVFRNSIAWRIFYLTADTMLNEELALPEQYYIQEKLSQDEMIFVKRLTNGGNQVVFSKLSKNVYSQLLEKGVEFSQVQENVYLLENKTDCIGVLFVDDLFSITVPESCNKGFELSSLIHQLRLYYSYETGVPYHDSAK